MANRKNNLSGVLNQLSVQKVDGQSINKLLSPTSVLTQLKATTEPTIKPTSSGDTRAAGFNAKTVAAGIKFGAPSNNRTNASQSGGQWASLLTQTASGGVASTISGGLSSIAGLGGLISGIASLFGGGGKSTPPPLIEFQLPESQNQTVYVSSNGTSSAQSTVNSPASATKANGATYISTPTPQANNSPGTQSLQYHSAQIAQAVKTALLNSSSLNDVIAEI